MSRTTLRRLVLFIAVALAPLCTAAIRGATQSLTSSARLEPGVTLERAISGSQTDLYTIDLAVGQITTISVEQSGAALSVRLLDADGGIAIEVESTRKDPQLLLAFVSNTSATQQVEVVRRYPLAPPGPYRLSVAAARAANQRDRLLDEAGRRQMEAVRLSRLGAFEGAQRAVERAIEIRTATLGPNHHDVAESIAVLAATWTGRDDFQRAEQLYQQALAINERADGADSLEAAAVQDALAKNHNTNREFAKAEQLAQRALDIRTLKLGAGHPLVAASLLTLSDIYMDRGDVGKAETTSNRAMEIAQQVFRHDDLELTDFTKRVALLLTMRGNYARAEELFAEILRVRERAAGPASLPVAEALRMLAGVNFRRADDVRTEEFCQRSLAITEPLLGPSSWSAFSCLNNMGLSSYRRRDYGAAEDRLTRALAIAEKVFGPSHVWVANPLNNLGLLYWRQKNYAKAEESFRRTIAVLEKTYGPDAFVLYASVANLGIIFKETGDYDHAEGYYLRALSLVEKTYGPSHPDLTATIEGLAILYRDRGEYSRAEPLFARALSITETVLGPTHPTAARHLQNLAALYAAAGDAPKARAAFRRMADIEEMNLPLSLAAGSERQKSAYFDSFMSTLERVISFHLGSDTQRESSDLAASMLFQRKARVLDVVADQLGALHQRSNSDDRQRLDQLSTLTSQLAALVLSGARSLPADQQQRIAALTNQRDELEREVSRRSAGYHEPVAAITLPAVASAIPPGAVLVEFFVHRPLDLKAAVESDAKFGPPRYVAYVVSHDGDGQWKDLGVADDIDRDVDALRLALRDPSRLEVVALGRALSDRIMRPLGGLIGRATRLLIAPDGQLSLVPFEALVDDQNHFLVERYSISYLSTGRDLVRMQVPRASGSPPVILAAPLFGEPDQTPRQSTTEATATNRDRRNVTAAPDLSSLYFAPLRATLEEARRIGDLFPDATILSRAEASESALKQVRAPSILHIATHGFFIDHNSDNAVPDQNRTAIGSAGAGGWAGLDNPLLRSGLALSGANLRRGQSDDGIFTALEAAQLNLWGTKLVTLSACDTGVGEVRNGEGVFGLRRSIFLAGAETLVMSLWPVNDYVTRDMMNGYYTRLKSGLGRGEALRQVQLATLRRKGREHPFYWASFIQSGEWANLDGKR